MNWAGEHWFKVGILIALLMFAASPAYYFIYYIPHRDAVDQAAAAAQALEKQQELQQQQQQAADLKQLEVNELQTCLSQAAADYQSNWEANCTLEGQKTTCTSLSSYHAANVTQALTQEKDDCFKEYPQG